MPRKKLLKYLVYFILILLGVEGSMRLLGYTTIQPFPILLEKITPNDALTGDSTIGFKLKENSTVHYEYKSGYSFVAEHDEYGSRICDQDSSNSELQIGFYGGSLFYGMGLNNSDVFAAKLAKKMKGVRLRNYAIFGQSMTTSYLQLKDQIDNNMKPDVAVITYATYNRSRNAFTYEFRRAIHGNSDHVKKKGIRYRYARLDDNNTLKFQFSDFGYSPFKLSEFSVISAIIERSIEDSHDSEIDINLIDQMLIDKIHSLCKQNGVQLVFAVISAPNKVEEIENKFTNDNIDFVNIFVDYENEKYNLMPYDNHPNATAHEMYAEKLEQYLSRLLAH